MTCHDNSCCFIYPNSTASHDCISSPGDVLPVTVGFDPEPAASDIIPQSIVLQNVVSNVVTGSLTDYQFNLWPEADNCALDTDVDGQTLSRYSLDWYFNGISPCKERDSPSFFVSALPNSTTTGVLHQHAIRLNYSIQCENIARSEFPSACSGTRPFITNFSANSTADDSLTDGSSAFSFRVCVPGDYNKAPWSLSRDRQDISEDIYIEVINGYYVGMHCMLNTTRGCFELGNYQNNYSYQPLLTSWPSKEVLMSDFNDYLENQESVTPSTM